MNFLFRLPQFLFRLPQYVREGCKYLFERAGNLRKRFKPEPEPVVPVSMAGSHHNPIQNAPSEEEMKRIMAGKEPTALLLRQRRSTDPPETLPLELLDINSASQETVAALPNVGGVLALLIIREREQNGAFDSMDNLCGRCKIKPHIRVALQYHIAFGKEPPAVQHSVRKGRRVD
ncbi:MAG: helix-hairpin-helix domain-containing protein [Planctomycetaceae bacterium]|jgi:hypothetical protein|nr:helix-hairpin-helix domain-containing protein [Planctomycetaceae bacterium]